MIEPLSITGSVLTLLGLCWNVGRSLKSFHDGASIVESAVFELLQDVEGLAGVLEAMKNTVESVESQSSLIRTGHVGNHWRHLARSLTDGCGILEGLQCRLERVNKNTNFLSRQRKQLRLNLATDDIKAYRRRLKSHRDAMQLSLSAIIVWNQFTSNRSTERTDPSLEPLDSEIRRLAAELTNRMRALESSVRGPEEQREIEVTSNLRDCVQAAATVVSSTSTTSGSGQLKSIASASNSDYRDCFPAHLSYAMQRWADTRTEYEFSVWDPDTGSEAGHKFTAQRGHSRKHTPSDSDSDSEEELEKDIIQVLYRHGQESLDAGDIGAAERALRNCYTRVTVEDEKRERLHQQPGHSLRNGIVECLLQLYVQQENWTEAELILTSKVELHGRTLTREDLVDLETLVAIYIRQSKLLEARQSARQVLKAYRKLGQAGFQGVEETLQLLVDISRADLNLDEEEAYAVMLSDIRRKTRSQEQADTNPVPDEQPKIDTPVESSESVLTTRVAGPDTDKSYVIQEGFDTSAGSNFPRDAKPTQSSEPSAVLHPVSKTIRRIFEQLPHDDDLKQRTPLTSDHVQQSPDQFMDLQREHTQSPGSVTDQSSSAGYRPPSVHSVHSDTSTLLADSDAGSFQDASSDPVVGAEDRDNVGSPESVTTDGNEETDDSECTEIRSPQSSVVDRTSITNASSYGTEVGELPGFEHQKFHPRISEASGYQTPESLTYRGLRVRDGAPKGSTHPPAGPRVSIGPERLLAPPSLAAALVRASQKQRDDKRAADAGPSKANEQRALQVFQIGLDPFRPHKEVDESLKACLADHAPPSENVVSSVVLGECLGEIRLSRSKSSPSPPSARSVKATQPRQGFRGLARSRSVPTTASQVSCFVDESEGTRTLKTFLNDDIRKDLAQTIENRSKSAPLEHSQTVANYETQRSLSIRTDELSTGEALVSTRPKSAIIFRLPGGSTPAFEQPNPPESSKARDSPTQSPVSPPRKANGIQRRLVCVGDGGCGKTGLIQRSAYGIFNPGTDPTFESDRYTIESEIDEPEGIVQLEVCDTAGTHDVDGLRKKAYADCHVVVIAFDMNSQDSLDNVGHKWISEVAEFAKNAKVVLVGCRKDLLKTSKLQVHSQKSQYDHPVANEGVKKLLSKVTAAAYFECSALTGEGVQEVFACAAKLAYWEPVLKNQRVKEKSSSFRLGFRSRAKSLAKLLGSDPREHVS